MTERSRRDASDPHRHCMVVHAYYPVGEARVQREAAALVAAGIEVDVICLRNEGEASFARCDGVDVHRLPVRRGRDRGMAAQLAEYLRFFVLAMVRLAKLQRRRRYRTVQVHNLPDFLVFAALPAKLAGSRVLLDLHDLMPEFFAAKTGRPMTHPLTRLIALQEKLACKFADHVITVTEHWRRDLAERSVGLDRSSVVMNLADPAVFGVDRPMARPGIDGGLDLVYHGTVTSRYGVDVAIEAVAQLRDELPGLRLRIFGDGEDLDDLMDRSAQLGLDDVVEFSGRMLGYEELIPLLAESDVGLVPNRSNTFTDGILPTKLLEYVALGIPTIVSRTPGVEAYFDESMVRFVTPGDVGELVSAVREVSADPSGAEARVEAAHHFSLQHNWIQQAESYAGLVLDLGAFRNNHETTFDGNVTRR